MGIAPRTNRASCGSVSTIGAAALARHGPPGIQVRSAGRAAKRVGKPVLVENSAAGLTWNFDAAMIGARVREAGLPAAGDRGVVACVAGAVLLI